MSKNHLSGGKYTGSHTTVIPAAKIIAEVANGCPNVTKISLGFIKNGIKAVPSIKITEQPGNLFISVKGSASAQELHVFTSNVNATKRMISEGAQKNKMRVSYRDCAE